MSSKPVTTYRTPWEKQEDGIEKAKKLSNASLAAELRDIANVLRMRDCPDSAGQCDEAANRLERPYD